MTSSADSELYFRLHVFICTNRRPADSARAGCGGHGAEAARDHLKSRAKALGLKDVRVNSAGCLGRCELGPVLVVYPDGVWYRFETIADIDEILDTHLGRGGRVERLLLGPDARPVLTA
ncbi:(2Fe-2S) ferredoxin domain-containing protein [Magnetospirillum molischianum]|uniref:Ferredoxin n=1 Tax=Magnetospirillum molischianum DSM 120 TaxID=1150626 RepID=H8FTE6_MAGML|nr:(2Fe-2S) ferredoxin domain-containing protein [Magnetospirillum molischianum]CCG41634.1 Ferredoxin [Magnetospirillum molischianum DSM 120]